MYKKAGLHIKALRCAVDYDCERKIATITPILFIECARRQLLAASVHIDDHELRPSLKLLVAEGTREYRIPYVRIANPVLGEYTYKLTVKLHLDNEKIHELNRDLQIEA
ncbi:MAG: hypothetical protein PHH77_12545 [Victivallaceae bacterium]|nr:hypothetical protein [Victivallaceae bacterium]